mmetsp:Transcript_35692/g.64273  ORF Transcript_35692/g.64273 Transcript_35692/m.64273 type:complete len:263 (+) Transcript_35692:87-875(+)
MYGLAAVIVENNFLDFLHVALFVVRFGIEDGVSVDDLGSQHDDSSELLLSLTTKGTIIQIRALAQDHLIGPTNTTLIIFTHPLRIHEQIHQLLRTHIHNPLTPYRGLLVPVVLVRKLSTPHQTRVVARPALPLVQRTGDGHVVESQSLFGHVLAGFGGGGPHHGITGGAVSHGDEGVDGLGGDGAVGALAVVETDPILVNVKLHPRRRMRTRMMIMRLRPRIRIVQKLFRKDRILGQSQIGRPHKVGFGSIVLSVGAGYDCF